MLGYDGVLSIEHEDSLRSPKEGLTKAADLLNNIVIREHPKAVQDVALKELTDIGSQVFGSRGSGKDGDLLDC
jgi:hypothetical protein